jgi:hypothetical protein
VLDLDALLLEQTVGIGLVVAVEPIGCELEASEWTGGERSYCR